MRGEQESNTLISANVHNVKHFYYYLLWHSERNVIFTASFRSFLIVPSFSHHVNLILFETEGKRLAEARTNDI